ncbi:MAG: hypothetical protein ACNS60_02520 [Candidatus Cyclobacteriaceae bacterium M2_1C_046]
MFIPFEQLRNDARIWVYQADRFLNSEEVDFLAQNLKVFTNQWAAHKKPLNSSFVILNNTHVIIGVDESVNDASGCSIDASVHVIQQLGQELGVNFFDRKTVAYVKDQQVEIASFDELKTLIEQGVIKPETLVFNNLVSSKELLDSNWKIEARNSWLKRYFKSSLAS